MISPRGNPNSPIWFVQDVPYDKDSEKGYNLSCPYGYTFDRFMRDAGINTAQCYYTSISSDPACADINSALPTFIQVVQKFNPVIICPLGATSTVLLCPETRKKIGKKNEKVEASLEKYAGSLLTIPALSHSHYCIPLLTPDSIVANWEYKFIHTQIDLGHVREELSYYNSNGFLQPYTRRDIVTEPTYSVLRDTLRSFLVEKLIAMDIETIRPRKESLYYRRMPGEMYLIGIANSPNFAISFCPWKYEEWQQLEIFRLLNQLFKTVSQVGQNYFTFDTHFTEAYGLEHCLDKCEDTMLRHQILWPELPHKLQFLCKQYTRQPYYKDEGQGWGPKNLKKYMNYNGLDCCITFETYLGQEEEFNDRPYLR